MDETHARIAEAKSALKKLINESRIDELENQLSNFVGRKYYEDPIKNIKDRINSLKEGKDI